MKSKAFVVGVFKLNLKTVSKNHVAICQGPKNLEQTFLICSIVKEKGFEFEREVTDHQAVYCQNPKSMLQYHYKCVFSTATKSSGGAPVM